MAKYNSELVYCGKRRATKLVRAPRRRKINPRSRFPMTPWRRKYSKALEPALRQRARRILAALHKQGVLDWFAAYVRLRYQPQGKSVNKLAFDAEADKRALADRAKDILSAYGLDVESDMRDLGKQLYGASSKQAFGKLGLDLTWNLDSPAVKSAFDSRVNYIKDMEQAQFDALLDTVRTQTYELGASPVDAQFLERLQEAAGKDALWQAERIARTETLAVTGAASQQVYQANGVERKEWIYSQSGYERHAGLDGEIVGIDEQFSNGLDFPGADGPPEEVINCMCAMAPVPSDEALDILYSEGAVNE
jgi:hypothetical protein